MWSHRSVCDMKTFEKHAIVINCHYNLLLRPEAHLSFVLSSSLICSSPLPPFSPLPLPLPLLCWVLITVRSGAGMSITSPDVRIACNAFVSHFIMSLECVIWFELNNKLGHIQGHNCMMYCMCWDVLNASLNYMCCWSINLNSTQYMANLNPTQIC